MLGLIFLNVINQTNLTDLTDLKSEFRETKQVKKKPKKPKTFYQLYIIRTQNVRNTSIDDLLSLCKYYTDLNPCVDIVNKKVSDLHRSTLLISIRYAKFEVIRLQFFALN